jgi:hypothetical protein
MQSFYTVVHSGKNVINIIDLRKNAIINRISFQGTLINGPIVVGDRCTIVTKVGNSQRGLVIKLPSGSVIDRFSA